MLINLNLANQKVATEFGDIHFNENGETNELTATQQEKLGKLPEFQYVPDEEKPEPVAEETKVEEPVEEPKAEEAPKVEEKAEEPKAPAKKATSKSTAKTKKQA